MKPGIEKKTTIKIIGINLNTFLIAIRIGLYQQNDFPTDIQRNSFCTNSNG